MKAIVGTWNEKEPRKWNECPSYYAADWQTIQTVPGIYPVTCIWEMYGWILPYPKLHLGVDSNILEGATYSGFCGVNFASTPIEPGPKKQCWSVSLYLPQIQPLMDDGRLTIKPEFLWLLERDKWPSFEEFRELSKTWEVKV